LSPEICKWSLEKTGCDIRCQAIDKIKNEKFDIVFAADVLEHIYDPRNFIHDAVKTLRPEGKAIFQTVIFDSWKNCPSNVLRPLFHTILFHRQSLKLLETNISTFSGEIPSVFGCSCVIFTRNKKEVCTRSGVN
jgi:2-polyprenyl-3-methyl-5-hydroxy-6-metoxy-1,4-benzoquinol methylase